MKTIVFAAAKGGTGKTTLAASLAAHACAGEKRRVALWDRDPQGSLSRWWEHRLRETGDEARPILLAGQTIDQALRGISAGRAAIDLLMVDGPPSGMSVIGSVIALADVVVIPVRPSLLDVEAVGPTAELCVQYNRKFAFVLNAVQTTKAGREMSVGARQYLTGIGPTLEAEVALRTVYASAMILGSTAPEQEAAARGEIGALLRSITKLIGAT